MNKQAMLSVITDFADLIMNASDYSVIPYYDIDNDTANRIRTYFSDDINNDDIVALISTSVFDTGKTGIVFTTYAVYTRDWGFLPKTDMNSYFEHDTATFTSSNDFDIDMLKDLMKVLFDIFSDELAKELTKGAKEIAKSLKDLFDI